MIVKKLHLKDYFEFLGENKADPTLDIYLPDEANDRVGYKRPCMLVCPGGGYAFTSPREGEPIALDFLTSGFNAFVLNYTVAPARFPTQIREVAAAMELIYKNSDEWGCDVSKVSIIGFSAGGHLAGHYSTMFDCREVREVFPDSKCPNASVLSYPVITAEEGRCHSGSFENLVGHYPLTEEEFNRFSLEKCVKDNTPPAFIWHTASDACVPVYSSLAYADALSKYKIPFELHIFPLGAHGLSTCDIRTSNAVTQIHEYDSVWLGEVKKWLKLMNLA